MTVVLFQAGSGPVHLSATTAGGSQAVFFKINTFGEDAFLDKLLDIIDGSIPYPQKAAHDEQLFKC